MPIMLVQCTPVGLPLTRPAPPCPAQPCSPCSGRGAPHSDYAIHNFNDGAKPLARLSTPPHRPTPDRSSAAKCL